MQRKPILCMTTATDIASNSLKRLVTYQNYAQAFIDQGAVVLCVSDTDPNSAQQLCQFADGLFLTGGADVSPALYGEKTQDCCGVLDPWRDDVELAYGRVFLEAKKPVFGICRGFQMLNVLLGGTLYQDIPAQLGRQHTYNSIHEAAAVPGSILEKLFGAHFSVNSFHHQAIRTLAPGLIPLAFSEGGTIVEAFHHTSLPVLAVQWHPERMTGTERLTSDGPDMAPLFQYFTALCTGKGALSI